MDLTDATIAWDQARREARCEREFQTEQVARLKVEVYDVKSAIDGFCNEIVRQRDQLHTLTAALTSLRDEMRDHAYPYGTRVAYADGDAVAEWVEKLDALLVSGETTKDDVLTRAGSPNVEPTVALPQGGEESHS